MKKMILAAAAMALSLPVAAQAAPSVTINFSSTTAISSFNDWKSNLNGVGLTQYATQLSSLFLTGGPANLVFEFLASESGFSDTFSATGAVGSVSYTETSGWEDHWSSPIQLGFAEFDSGDLFKLLNFTSNLGGPATVGDDGFGIFLGPNARSGGSYTQFYIGYDDQIGSPDDNHDDFIVRVSVVPLAVPEPSTWAMLLFGFGIVGFALRRRISRTAAFA